MQKARQQWIFLGIIWTAILKRHQKKSLSWMHYHNHHEVICLCSSARKTHKRNWDLSLTPKSCIPSANKGLRLMHWPVKAAEGPLSSTHAPDSCCLCRCGAVVWYLIGGTRSWAQSEWGVTVVWTWAAHTHHAAHCPCACPGPGVFTLKNLRVFKVSSPTQTILWWSASYRCVWGKAEEADVRL